MLKFDDQQYQLYTIDHDDDGRLRLDVQHAWSDASSPVPVTPPEELICDANSGWLCSQLDCDLQQQSDSGVKWFNAGPTCLLSLQDDLLVEYDMQTRSPVGLVAFVEGKVMLLRLCGCRYSLQSLGWA